MTFEDILNKDYNINGIFDYARLHLDIDLVFHTEILCRVPIDVLEETTFAIWDRRDLDRRNYGKE